MDTLEFFRAILPETGPYYLVIFREGDGPPAHYSCVSLEEMAERALKYDANSRLAVYHACASYLEPFVMVGEKKKYRIEPNWGRAKALWIDIDCGEEKAAKGEGYGSKGEAVRSVDAFCKATSLPTPVVVDSGGGVHCYWPFEKSISHEAWRALANAFKALLAHHHVLADPTCTADFARVLRPVGTTNRKREARSVVSKNEARVHPAAVIRDAICAAVSEHGVTVPSQTAPRPAGDDINSDLTSHTAINIPSSAALVAAACAQVAKMRDTRGDVSYEHWRGVIGLIKHCVEGKPLAQEWSIDRAATGHTNTDLDTRYETWNSGPPTCEFFSKAAPDGCVGCPHAGKIKSPIMLGRVVPEPTEEVVDSFIDGREVKVQVPKLPGGYKWEADNLVRYLKDKDDIWQPFPFCRTLFYPIYRVHKESGEYSMGMRMHLPDKRVRDFEIDTGLLASPAKLMEELGHRGEIVQTNSKDSSLHMTAYLRDHLEQLKHRAEELNTMTSFGWKYDMKAFLIGDRLFHSDGSIRKVLVGGYAADYLNHFPEPKGTLDGYAQGLNHVYDRVGMEPLQYAICSAFGSILTPFGENMYRGLLVAITGGESGKGKSTVCHAGLYGFGDAKRMTIGTEKGATANFQFAQLGTYGSLPMLFDEYTNVEPEEFSSFAYRISQGEEKGRLTIGKGGVRKASQVNWWLSPFVTANKDLHQILATNTANSQAEAVRMIQIKIDEYSIPQLSEGEVDSALTQMRINSGSAGEAFIAHVVTRVDETFELFRETIAAVSAQIPGPKYRYYRNHAAATLAAARILGELGVVRFNYSVLFEFTVTLMRKLCEAVVETNTVTPEDALSQFLNEVGPRILTTVEYRDSRDARGPERTARINQTIAGRYIYGATSGQKDPLSGRLYLVKKELKDWCMKHRVEMSAVLGYAKDNAVLLNETERFTLTRGTDYATANMRCVVLDMDRLASLVVRKPKLVVNNQGDIDVPGEEAQGR